MQTAFIKGRDSSCYPWIECKTECYEPDAEKTLKDWKALVMGSGSGSAKRRPELYTVVTLPDPSPRDPRRSRGPIRARGVYT